MGRPEGPVSGDCRGVRLGFLDVSETGLTGLGDFVGTLAWGFAPGFGRPALQALIAGGQLRVVSCQLSVVSEK